MPPLPNKPPKHASVFNKLIRRNPAILGVPFICAIVGGSYGLSQLTQMRYDVHDGRTRQVTTAEQEKLEKMKKRKFDIREEYFRMQAGQVEEWEPVRIARPEGTPEWGVAPDKPRVVPETGELPRSGPARRPNLKQRTPGPDSQKIQK
ncbi:cytochrome c oxidase assembly protein COX16-domain-containing protein, partial [Auriculariales sp. MPI-PUGE-AT-0066]